MAPDVSIVIPAYNQGEALRYSLESVRRAAACLAAEVIVIDDGSDPPAADFISRLGFRPDRIIRQANRGLLFARLAGLDAAAGRYLLFLDSDDLISSDKLHGQVAAMEAAHADVSYTDTGRCALQGDFAALAVARDSPAPETSDAAEFFISVQPAPHSPMFRADYLRRITGQALFPPAPLYNPVAEIWFYHNAAVQPARICKVPGPLAIIGEHPGTRLTGHWERLGVASLAVQEAFVRACPATPATARARQLAAEKAFGAWRRLPRGFAPEFGERLLQVWRRLNQRADYANLGGGAFRLLARLLGPVRAGQMLKLAQNPTYARVCTLDAAAVRRLLAALPPP